MKKLYFLLFSLLIFTVTNSAMAYEMTLDKSQVVMKKDIIEITLLKSEKSNKFIVLTLMPLKKKDKLLNYMEENNNKITISGIGNHLSIKVSKENALIENDNTENSWTVLRIVIYLILLLLIIPILVFFSHKQNKLLQ